MALANAYLKRYPRTGATRYWIDQYNWAESFSGEAPKTIKIHEVYQAYGGPQEGGWWYEVGQAIATHCIFSKKQCIRRCLELTKHYDLFNQGSVCDSRNLSATQATLGSGYATHYPTERPYYC